MKWILFLLFLINGVAAQAMERLGLVRVEEVLLRPRLVVSEPQEVEFLLGESAVSFQWVKSANLSGVIRLGSLRLLNQPVHFVPEEDLADDLGIYEAYGQWQGVYGLVRFGLIPIEYAATGTFRESQLRLPRSLLFQKRAIGLRDLGLSYQIHHKGFYHKIAVHNGEGVNNPDKRMFVTSSWGWQNYRNINVGVSGQTGTTKALSTSNSKSNLAAVDVNQNAKWRTGTAYIHWHPNAWDILLETTLGELDQQDKIEKFLSWHMDISYRVNSFLSLMSRYDQFDPNDNLENDLQREASVGFSIHGDDDTSVLYFLGTKKWEQGVKQANDQFQMIWQITPLSP